MPRALAAGILACVVCASVPRAGAAQGRAIDEKRLWAEFVELAQRGPLPSERIKPYYETIRAPLIGFISALSKAPASEWRKPPRIYRVGMQRHFLLPLSVDGDTATYCFSFLLEDTTWYFQHLEAITVPMDSLGPLPLSRFPDMPERDKAWMRDEIAISQEVRMYNTLVADHGVTTALDWFKDGPGYALGARAWVPFVSPERAFILYFAWDQADLHGQDVVLQQLDDSTAVVQVRARYLELYRAAAHLKQMISESDYRTLYESRWRNRAEAAGWNLNISCQLVDCTFRFGRRR